MYRPWNKKYAKQSTAPLSGRPITSHSLPARSSTSEHLQAEKSEEKQPAGFFTPKAVNHCGCLIRYFFGKLSLVGLITPVSKSTRSTSLPIPTAKRKMSGTVIPSTRRVGWVGHCYCSYKYLFHLPFWTMMLHFQCHLSTVPSLKGKCPKQRKIIFLNIRWVLSLEQHIQAVVELLISSIKSISMTYIMESQAHRHLRYNSAGVSR